MTLNEIFPDWKTGKGIFHFIMASANVMPWEMVVSSQELDMIYHGLNSGSKEVGPLVQAYMIDNVVSEEDKQAIAESITAIKHEEWTRVYNALFAEYNPIENYSAIEEGTDTRTNTGTQTTDNSTQHGHIVQSTNSNNTTTDQSIFGYDSAVATPEGKAVVTDGGNGTETHSGTDKVTDKRTDDLTETNTHKFKRSGNIGVTTSQQMIESEIELRKQNYFSIVFADLDKYLTLRVY